MANDLHKQHRERVRKEFLENGFSDSTSAHKFLELLLFYCIPRKDTNETAHLLLKEFGSLSGVLEAETSDLIKVKGIGENAAALIKLMLPLFRKYQSEKTAEKPKFTNMDDIFDFLIKKYIGYTSEVFMVTSFDNEGCMIACDKVSKGDTSSVGVPIRDIIQIVLKRNTSFVIISHNHTSGNALPSMADIEMTKILKTTLNQMGVKLLDHVIVVTDDCVSLFQSKEYKDIFV
jgi:DNA repair protein RadC